MTTDMSKAENNNNVYNKPLKKLRPWMSQETYEWLVQSSKKKNNKDNFTSTSSNDEDGNGDDDKQDEMSPPPHCIKHAPPF